MASSSSRSDKKDAGNKAGAAKKNPQPVKKTGEPPVKKTASSSSVTATPPVRLCHLVRRPDFDGYGFGVLVDEKSKVATVTSVEKGGPAEAGDLRPRDCIVQVNGVDVVGASQRDVVDRIKSTSNEVRLLVTNKETVALYKERGLSFSTDMSSVLPTNSATETPLKDKKAKLKDKSSKAPAKKPASAESSVAGPPSPILSRRGSLIIPIEEPSSSDDDKRLLLPRGKDAKAIKSLRPPAKNAKPLANPGPTAAMSKNEQNLLQKHKQARTAADRDTEQDRASAPEPNNERRANLEFPENPPSTLRGRRGGDSSRPQVRWLSVRSPESIGSPPYSYSSQGNDYEAYLEGYMADPDDSLGWPSEAYFSSAAAPFSTASYGAQSAFPIQYDVLPLDPYNVFAPFHPQDFYWPLMAPYRGTQMQAVSGPFYGYTSTYAPGYSEFFALYPGYASYEPLHQASASPDRRERQRTVRAPQERQRSYSSTPPSETSIAKSTKSTAAGPSSKAKDETSETRGSARGDKGGEKKGGKKTSNKV